MFSSFCFVRSFVATTLILVSKIALNRKSNEFHTKKTELVCFKLSKFNCILEQICDKT